MENPFTVKQVMIFIHMVIFPIPEVTNTNFPDGSVFVGLFLLKYKTSCYHCDDQFHASPVDSVNLKLILKSLFFFFFSWPWRFFEEFHSWQAAWSVHVRLLTSVTRRLTPKYSLWICLCLHQWTRTTRVNIHLSGNADDNKRLNFKYCDIFLRVHKTNLFRNNFSYKLNSNSFSLERTPSWIEDISSSKLLLLL